MRHGTNEGVEHLVAVQLDGDLLEGLEKAEVVAPRPMTGRPGRSQAGAHAGAYLLDFRGEQDGVVSARLDGPFPWGTFLVNLSGCILIGLFAAWPGTAGRALPSSETRAFLMIGLCGGYTTFSTFSLDTVTLAESRGWGAAATNVLASAMGAVIREELRGQPSPRMSSTSPTAPGMARDWETADALIDEVALARIYDGVHFRNSTVVGNQIGKAVGTLVQQRFARP